MIDFSKFKLRDDDFTGLAFAMAMMYPGQFKQLYPEIAHAHWLVACEYKLELSRAVPSSAITRPRKLFLTGASASAPPH